METFFNVGSGEKPIAYILGRTPRERNEKVYLDREGEYEEIRPPEDRLIFPLFHSDENQVNHITILGKNGTGKSTIANKILKEMLNRDPSKKIWLFSPNEHDHSIDQGLEDKINRAEPRNYELELFTNTITVFDDIESLSDKKRLDALHVLLRKIMEGGRKHKADVIFIGHTFRDKEKTKYIHQESNCYIIFPGTGNDAQVSSFLKAYVGFSKTANQKILNTRDSRWLLIHNAHPCYVMTQHEIYKPPRDEPKKKPDLKRKRGKY